jgi:hypothetical protein
MQDVFTKNSMVDYKSLFLVPFGAATVAAIALALFFHPPATPTAGATAGSAPH